MGRRAQRPHVQPAVPRGDRRRAQSSGPPGLRIDVPEAKGTCDFLGVNLYGRRRVRFSPRDWRAAFNRFAPPAPDAPRGDPSAEEKFGEPTRRASAALDEWLARIGKPLVITENGYADALDRVRPAVIVEAVRSMHCADRAGIRRARLSPLDAGRQLRVGRRLGPAFRPVRARITATQDRKMRRSGHFFGEVARRNGLDRQTIVQHGDPGAVAVIRALRSVLHGNARTARSASCLLLVLPFSAALAWAAVASEVTMSSSVEESIRDCANRERRERGMRTLKHDPALDAAARLHARRMLDARASSTTRTPTGNGPADRVKRFAKRRYVIVGENIAAGFDSTGATCRGWMKSPGHRANILRTSFTRDRRRIRLRRQRIRALLRPGLRRRSRISPAAEEIRLPRPSSSRSASLRAGLRCVWLREQGLACGRS